MPREREEEEEVVEEEDRVAPSENSFLKFR